MSRGVSRRRVLQLGAAFASAPIWSSLAQPTQPDVVVVGAGAAGMAAARSLIEAGLAVTVALHGTLAVLVVAAPLWLHRVAEPTAIVMPRPTPKFIESTSIQSS